MGRPRRVAEPTAGAGGMQVPTQLAMVWDRPDPAPESADYVSATELAEAVASA